MPELGELLRNPQIEPGTKRDALDAALGEADESFRSFIRLVAEKGRIDELEQIYEEWLRLLAAEERILTLELTTAVELTDDEADRIVGKIEKAAGRKVEATRLVDPDLIGGLVLQAARCAWTAASAAAERAPGRAPLEGLIARGGAPATKRRPELAQARARRPARTTKTRTEFRPTWNADSGASAMKRTGPSSSR